MNRFQLLFPSALVGVLALASPAAADGVRYDICTEESDSCDNAIPGRRAQDPEGGEVPGGQPPKTVPGTCQNAKCAIGGPDGTIAYDCLRCIEVRGSGGSGGTESGGVAGSSGSDDANAGGAAGSGGMAGSAGSGAEESGGSAGSGAPNSGGSGGSALSGGSGGLATSGGSGGSLTSGGAAGTGGSRSGCDCGASGVMPQRSFAILLLLVGLVALARSRRRQRWSS